MKNRITLGLALGCVWLGGVGAGLFAGDRLVTHTDQALARGGFSYGKMIGWTLGQCEVIDALHEGVARDEPWNNTPTAINARANCEAIRKLPAEPETAMKLKGIMPW
jgi:hypothetical protein